MVQQTLIGFGRECIVLCIAFNPKVKQIMTCFGECDYSGSARRVYGKPGTVNYWQSNPTQTVHAPEKLNIIISW
jgi:hypothetical protein